MPAKKSSRKQSRKISPDRLRKFRTDAAKLKKAGIIPASVNVRSLQPTKHYRKLTKDFRGVINGNQRTVKLSKKFVDEAKESGLKTHGKVVIIDNPDGMRVIYDKKDPFGYHLRFPSKGYEMIQHRGPRGRSLAKYAEYAESQLEPGGYVGFTVQGYRSTRLYSSVSEAISAFERYNSMKFGSRSEQVDVASSFTIYRVPKSLRWKWRPSNIGKRKRTKKR